MNALADAGITVVAGAEGNADEAVEAYLRGELVSSGANCDHHHHEEGHSCGHHDGKKEAKRTAVLKAAVKLRRLRRFRSSRDHP